jgi:hypothetical protein
MQRPPGALKASENRIISQPAAVPRPIKGLPDQNLLPRQQKSLSDRSLRPHLVLVDSESRVMLHRGDN